MVEHSLMSARRLAGFLFTEDYNRWHAGLRPRLFRIHDGRLHYGLCVPGVSVVP